MAKTANTMTASLLFPLLCLSYAWAEQLLPTGCFYAQGGILCTQAGYESYKGEVQSRNLWPEPVGLEADVPIGSCRHYSDPQSPYEICNTGDEVGKLRKMFIATIDQGGAKQTCKAEWITKGLRLWCENAGRIDIAIPENQRQKLVQPVK